MVFLQLCDFLVKIILSLDKIILIIIKNFHFF